PGVAQIIGVDGRSRLETALFAIIVEPRRLDNLQPVPGAHVTFIVSELIPALGNYMVGKYVDGSGHSDILGVGTGAPAWSLILRRFDFLVAFLQFSEAF